MYRIPHIERPDLLKAHTKRERSSNSYYNLFGLRTFIALAFCLLMTVCTLVFSGSAIQAKGVSQSTYQGLILQVDRTNSNDVMFSLLDHHGTPFTFHLTASTRFSQHQSASQLNVNLLVSVKAKPDAAGALDATSIQLRSRNKAPFQLQGVVASVDQTANSITIALSDGTMLTITVKNASAIQTGATITLKANFTAAGILVASTYHIVTPHASHFQARGIISHINARVHLLTLVSPVGASFSVIQGQNQPGAFQLGEKVNISGSSDNKGNLNLQSATVENATDQYLTVIGMVSAIDTTAGKFSLVDKQGNSSTVNASSDLLASLQVGGVYQLEIGIASDGSMTLNKVLSSQGNDKGNTISIEGTVQFYDASSGLLNISTDDGQSFSLQINNQTTIVNSDGTPGTLASGEAIHSLVRLHTDGTYSVMKIEIQATTGSGDQITFVGFFLYYDNDSGNLTINPGHHHRLLFATDSNTQIEGISSLDTIDSWSIVKVTAQVQDDGSYLATLVQVVGSSTQNSYYHSMKP